MFTIPGESESFSHGACPSIYLDYGADADTGPESACEISDRGMQIESRWQFSIGTQLSVSLQHSSGYRSSRMQVEGIVVWCEPMPNKRYKSTLLFLELPDDLRDALREFAHPDAEN